MNRIWLSIAAAVLACGCYLDLGEDAVAGPPATPTDPALAFDMPGEGTPVEVRNASLAGDMGALRGFDDNVWLEQGTSGDGWASVEIQSADREAGWAAMTRVQIQGGVERLEPGLRQSFTVDGTYELGPGADPDGEPTLFVGMVGCSGQMPGEWDWDVPAEQVEIQVDEGSEAGWVQVRFEATFRGFDVPETQLVSGSFEVERPEEGTTDL